MTFETQKDVKDVIGVQCCPENCCRLWSALGHIDASAIDTKINKETGRFRKQVHKFEPQRRVPKEPELADLSH